MVKSKAPSVLEAISDLQKGAIQPIYYLFGEDTFNLDSTLKAIEEAVEPGLSSDFDKETFYGENRTLTEAIDFASTFPFGLEKKLLIFKQFEKVKDKKHLKDYSLSPADFTVLVLIHNGTITNLTSEPYKTLLTHHYLFEAKELKGKQLVDWLVSFAKSKGKLLVEENAQILVDMVGENRNMLEAQLDKILIYLGEKKEISIESIQKISSTLKQYNIFDLQNAIGKKNKPQSIKVAFNLLDNGFDAVFIVTMLTRYFTGLSKVPELKKSGIPDNSASKIVGTHPFYYSGYISARNLYSDSQLVEVFRALLKADITIKTTSLDEKTIITVLLSEILI
jgi:DNA polymerase-3 subunit delta